MNLAQQLEEVLRLVKETGDRCVVISETHDPFVVMNLDQYRRLLKAAADRERLTTLSQDELLEKINQDIAEWREARRDDLGEYDLSQFRVGDNAPVRARKAQEYGRMRREPARPQIPNLPIVADGPSEKYHLEPEP
jgi:PHD/YefM family antitoxin component YafN of YafNO toxin-antitoxin module